MFIYGLYSRFITSTFLYVWKMNAEQKENIMTQHFQSVNIVQMERIKKQVGLFQTSVLRVPQEQPQWRLEAFVGRTAKVNLFEHHFWFFF